MLKYLKFDNRYLLAYVIFVLMFIGIRYTSDWNGYQKFLETPELCPDLLFRFIAEYVHGKIEFSTIYKAHIFLMGGVYLLLIRRTVDCPAIAILYAVDIYLFMANQIRFYLAWPIMLLAIFSFYKKEFIIFAILAILSILSHKSVILLLPCAFLCNFFLRRMCFEKAICLLFGISLVVGLFSWHDFGSGFGLRQLHYYQQISKSATITGLFFAQLPYLTCLALIISIHRSISKITPNVLDDLIYRYLLVLSLVPILFIGFSFYVTVFSQRFSLSMILIWFMYFYWSYCKYANRKQREGIVVVAAVVFFINPFFACFYALYKGNYFHCMEIFRMLHSYSLLL